jgi:hypothetical protein
MKYYITLLTTVIAAGLAACGGEAPVNSTNATTAPSNTNATTSSNANSLEGVRRPDAPTTNDAPTLGPVVKAFYDALKRRDDAAVRASLTREQLKSIDADLKERNRTDIAAFLAEIETLSDEPLEVRNEQIQGERGVAEAKGGGVFGNWSPLGFRLEDGKWKLSGDNPDIKTVAPSKP